MRVPGSVPAACSSSANGSSPGHVEVEQHQVRRQLHQALEHPLRPVQAAEPREAGLPPEPRAQRLAEQAVVVHAGDGRHVAGGAPGPASRVRRKATSRDDTARTCGEGEGAAVASSTMASRAGSCRTKASRRSAATPASVIQMELSGAAAPSCGCAAMPCRLSRPSTRARLRGSVIVKQVERVVAGTMGAATCTGRSSVKVAPCPGSDSTVTSPPARCASARTTAMPSPVLNSRFWVVKNGSKHWASTSGGRPAPLSLTPTRMRSRAAS